MATRGYREYAAQGGRPPQPLDNGGPYKDSAWVEWVLFAGILLILLGSFHVIQGLVALFRDQEVLVVGSSRLLINVDYTAWGWTHLLTGVIAILAGASLFKGRLWARIVAVLVAFASAMISMAFLPAYPIGSTIMIAMNIVIIWSVTVHGAELKDTPLP